MLKVILIDDEPIIRQGLRLGFDWAANGCEVVGEAENGIEAFKKIKDLNPDIAITDIRMPKYDGIEFMKNLKNSQLNTQIIVLSGYDDFVYAKEALDAGAFAYLLKPVNLELLAETLRKLKIKIEELKKIHNAEITYTNIKIEELLMSMITTPENSAEILKNTPGIANKLSGNYFVAILSVDDINSINKTLINVSSKLKKCIDNFINDSQEMVIKIQLTQTQYILTFFQKNINSYESTIQSLEKLLENFRKSSGATATIGISGIFRNLKLISKAYAQAEYALNSSGFLGKNTLIDYIKISDAKANKCYMAPKTIEYFSLLIREKNYMQIKEELKLYFAGILSEEKIAIEIVKSNIIEIAVIMFNHFASDMEFIDLMFGRNVNPIDELRLLNSMEEIKEWIFSVLDTLITSVDLFGKNVVNENVKKAILYIVSNYDKKLTIELVANKLYISSRHLMRCFKQETGVTFNDYLTNYRMQKAIRLFETKKYNIYEVSQLVGYNDSRHFCKLFKKFTGKTPGEIK